MNRCFPHECEAAFDQAAYVDAYGAFRNAALMPWSKYPIWDDGIGRWAP